ncbi:MAG: IS3 family transposase [Bacilli bacterium]|jgi:putative transposase|nr:IS3 family transposase [Bacilli bacterium]MCH3909273.1 IS3 family transposase [Bacilli bacterium]MCH3909280.1 IS3 family transposase [Bacilli bacterium]
MELSGKWPVKALCDEMSVNRSGFYKYRARRIAPSERAVKKANDIALFLTFHRKHPSHGYRWLNAKIRLDLGLVMSDEYARRCCRYAGIVSESRHYRYRRPGEPNRSYPNMILASLDVTGPFQVVVSDMTAFWAAGQYWELTLYMDLWDDEIVGWGLTSKKGDPSGYYIGLAMFLEAKKEKYMGLETIFHTDHGSVYSSKGYNEILQPYDITRTMSKPGTPTENGAMESINGWLKTELFMDFLIKESDDVAKQVANYVKYFNEGRPMCCLGYLTPKQYRDAHLPEADGSKTAKTCLRLPAIVSTYR